MYCFGVYHWRRRFRRLGVGLLLLLAACLAGRREGRRWRLAAAVLGLVGGRRAWGPLRRLLSPPPWGLDRARYRRLAAHLPYDAAENALDVGCGTGRSLVGLAPAVPADCTVSALDVFDDRVILGNGPALARRNAARAGLDAQVLAGDAARLPVADDTQDVVTCCRVLHDLPHETATDALAEARRVLRHGGTLGVLELPVPHDADADPETYWRNLVADAGFDVETVEVVPDEDPRSFVVVATPGE